MPFIDGERAPSPNCNQGGGLATYYFSGGANHADMGLVATVARERLAVLLSIQRTVSYSLVDRVRRWLQLSLGQCHCNANGAAAADLPLFTGGNLQIGGSLQLPVTPDRRWTECGLLRAHRGVDSSDREADLW